MTYPISPTSKFVRTSVPNPNGGILVTREQSRSGYKQKRPYDLPLACSLSDLRSLTDTRDSRRPGLPPTIGELTAWWWDFNRDAIVANAIKDAQNSARSRFSVALGGGESVDNAGIGINWSQRKEAASMMTGRLESLLRFSKKLRASDFVGAARELSMLPQNIKKDRLRKGAKFFASNWLEYHFGWEPLIKDIYSAIDVLQMDVPHGSVKGSGKIHVVSNTYSNPTNERISYYRELNVKAKMGATIVVTNPNLYLANKMGLVNPIAVAWDLVPFSFVADWLLTTSDVLNAFSDTYGVTMSNAWNSYGCRSFVNRVSVSSYTLTMKGERFEFRRALGIPAPILKVRPARQLSVARGATAAALLAGYLKG